MSKQIQFKMAGNAAKIYEDEFVPALFGPWAGKILDHTGLRLGAEALDVACGTGVGARETASRCGTEGGKCVSMIYLR